jgi:hypothetical protein
MKKAVLTVLICGLPNLVRADEPPPILCTEIAIFALGTTLERDKGVKASTLKQDIEAERNFSPADKKDLKRIVEMVFSRPQTDSTTMFFIAEAECKKAGKR